MQTIKQIIRSALIGFLTKRASFRNSFFEATIRDISKRIILDAESDKNETYFIQSGPFQGCEFLKSDYFFQNRPHEIALKIVGLYEQEVLSSIDKSAGYYNIVSLGAADGYYAISMLKKGFGKKAFLIETDTRNYALINRNSDLNAIPSCDFKIVDNISEALEAIRSDDTHTHNNVLICDIEGNEYQLFMDSSIIQALNSARFDLIIELHDYHSELRDRLKSQLFQYYEVSTLNSDLRNHKNAEAIRNKYERFAFAAEDRGGNFEFIFCRPKSLVRS